MKTHNRHSAAITAVFAAFTFLLATHAPAQTSPALLWGKVSGPWASQFDGSFGAIAVDPANPNIILVGSSVLGGPGILKSTDGGTTWTAKNTGINLLGIPAQNLPAITKIVFSPSNPSIVYFCAAVDNGLSASGAGYIYKSVDGGETWQEINGQQNYLGIYQIQGAVYDMDVNPQNPNIVYAGVGGQGVMETTDGGTDWSVVYAANSTPGAADFFTVVRVLPTQPNTVFFSGFTYYTEDTIPVPIDFSTTGTQGLIPISLHKSTDGGSTWSTIPDPSTAMLITDLQFEKATGNLYESTIAYQTPVFYNVGNSGIFKSLDSGQTWQSINRASFASLDQLPFVALLANPSSVNGGVFASGGLSTMLVGTTNAGVNWMNLDPCLLNAYIGRAALSSNTLFILTSVGIYRADASTLFPTASPAPSTTSISPASLPTSSSPQLITIYGTNFKPAGDPNASTLIFHDPANNPYVRTPTNVTANSLQYNVNVQSAAGTWSVMVTNAGSAASNPQTFTVYTPPANTGSLVVNLSPSGIGAQWQVNGTYYNSGDVVASLTPGQYTVSFKSVSGYTTPASFPVNIVANAQTTTNATYTAVASPTYTLTLNAVNGSISPSPTASGNVYNSGSIVQLTAYANTGYHFTSWSGAATGTANPTTITMSANQTVTANFASGDPNLATVTVTIKPDAAANAGVTWSVTGDSQLRASGTSLSEDVGSGYTTYLPVTLNLVAGWLGTNGATSFYVPVTAGLVTNVTLLCVPNTTPGLLTVTLSPPDAVNAGAHWHVNGGTYGQGASVSLTPGNYTVTFDAISGWTAPASQPVTMQPSQTIALSGNYTPPAGQPAIISISPPIGPNAGGTLMTINGANFSATTNVLIGGNSGSNIAVSATQITCLTPSSTTNGSVPVIVQTTGGSATNSNGFAYGLPLGTNMSLVSAIGGNCYGIYVQGNYAYLGEGKNLVVINTSTSSKVGQITLPGIVYDIQLLNQRAYVADGNGGLQVVDVSDPTAPKIVGFYSSTNNGWTMGISIYGGRAYVADESAGLEIFGLGNPTVPTLLSSTNIGRAVAVIVKASSSGAFAYVSDGNNLYVVDVSNPNAPVARGQTSTGDWGGIYALSSSGNYVFQADPSSGIHMIDVSNPDAPTNNTIQITGDNGTGGYVAVAAANNYLYAESLVQGVGFRVLNINGSSLTPVGQNINLYAGNSYAERMFISGNQAYVAAGALGLQIVNISNPANPSLTFSFTDSALYGDYGSVGVTGNILCASDGNNLKVFDVSQTGQPPAFVGQVSGIGAYKIVAANGAAYVTASDGIRLYSVATPSNPQFESTISSSIVTSLDMQIVGTRLYVAGYFYSGSFKARFKVIDVSNPLAPVVLGGVDFPDSNALGSSVAVNGSKALVGINTGRISLLDISNVSLPVERGSIAITGNSGGIQPAVQISPDGNYAYYILYGESPSLLHVVNISNLSNPLTITNVPVDAAGAVSISLRGSELYAGTYNGLYVFDISNPASPTLTRSYQIPGISSYVGGICAPSESANQDANIYVADEDGGIVSLQEQDIQVPEIYITDPIFGNTWTTTSSSTELGGGSDDNVGVTAITWVNNRGGSGQVSPPLDNWYVPSIALYPGTNILTVTAYDAAGNSGTDSLAVIYQTTNQNQTITFPAIADHTFGDAPITLEAAASSGLPVNFSIISGPAILTSSNVLTLTGAGAVTVQASQPGNSSYNPAPSTNVSFTVALANQAITFAPIPSKSATDAPFALTATTSSGLPVYFSVLSGPAILGTNNNLTLLAAGLVTVVAWQPGNSNYNAAASVQQTFNVSLIPQSITFGAMTQQKYGDAPFSIYASASSGLPVSLSVVSGPAQLAGNILTLTGSGTVTVRAAQSGNNIYAAAANVDQSLTVLPTSNTVGSPQYNASGFNLTFYGTVGSNYVFQASSNLVNWTTLLNFSCTNSIMNFQDTSATGYAHRFYQIKPQ